MPRYLPQNSSSDTDKTLEDMASRYWTQPSGNKDSAWQKMLMQLAMANKTKPSTMAGYALGRLLRQGFDSWKENYDARDDIKNHLATLSEDELNQRMEELRRRNPHQADLYEKLLPRYRNQQPQAPEAAPAEPSQQINPAYSEQAVKQYAQNLPQLPPFGQAVQDAAAAPQSYDFQAPSLEEMLRQYGWGR